MFGLSCAWLVSPILGWVIGSHEVEEVENRMMAAHANALVISVDYRMAPEYKFPYAVNDCFDVLKWVSRILAALLDLSFKCPVNRLQCKTNASTLGINPEKIIVAGGSAGGNIVSPVVRPWTPADNTAHSQLRWLKRRETKVCLES